MILFAKATTTANNKLSASNLSFMPISEYIDKIKRREIFDHPRQIHYIMFCTEEYNGLYKISGLSRDAVNMVFGEHLMNENIHNYLTCFLTKKVQKELGYL